MYCCTKVYTWHSFPSGISEKYNTTSGKKPHLYQLQPSTVNDLFKAPRTDAGISCSKSGKVLIFTSQAFSFHVLETRLSTEATGEERCCSRVICSPAFSLLVVVKFRVDIVGNMGKKTARVYPLSKARWWYGGDSLSSTPCIGKSASASLFSVGVLLSKFNCT